MTNYRIIYPNDLSGISVVIPAPGVSQEQVLSTIPIGKPYRIVSVEDIPTDRTFRDAWTADFTDAPVKD